jgi:hypothetical protein
MHYKLRPSNRQDGRIIRAHQRSSGAVGTENQGIGKSVGGNTTKIHMAVDAFGLPIEFLIEELNPEWCDLYEDICC